MSPSPIAAKLFTTAPDPHLIGGRHRQTGKLVFPLPANPAYESVELPPCGVLWSFTIQRFAPKSPPYRGSEPFKPFAVGYVELPGALIVESRLTEAAFETLRVGMPMELTTIDVLDGQGSARQCYAFRPSTAPGNAA